MGRRKKVKDESIINTENSVEVDATLDNIIAVLNKQFELAKINYNTAEVMNMSAEEQSLIWESNSLTKEQVEELKTFYKETFSSGYAGMPLSDEMLEMTFNIFFTTYGLPIKTEE